MENRMKLSEKVYDKKFPEAKATMFGGGNAGYDKTRVNLFLDELAPELEKLEKRVEELEQKNKMLMEEMELRTSVETKEVSEDDETNPLETDSLELDDQMKRRMRQIETLDRSYKRMIFMAEQEAEEIRSEAKEQARKMLMETQTKSDLLLKEVNSRYEDKEDQIRALDEVKGETEKQLLTIAEYIMTSTGRKKVSS